MERIDKKMIEKIANAVYWAVMAAVLLWLLYWVVQITTACSFHTPSGSMMPTLRPDESGLVNKWKLGARIFDIFGLGRRKARKD